MALSTLVIGKIGFDLDFSVSDNIFDNKTTQFRATDMKRIFSGLAANIAYGVSILGGKPVIISIVGRDFDLYYRKYLENKGIALKLFYDNERETACIFNISSPEDRILHIKQNNSYRFFAEKDIIPILSNSEVNNLSVVFIGTGIIEADVKFVSDIHKLNDRIPLIYSPDLAPKSFVKWRLNQILQKISILVCKEDELIQFEKILGLGRQQIIETSKRLKYIITIHDRSKIVIHSKDLMTKVSDAPAEKIVSDKGWYDAFRAGLVYGVSLKKPIIEAAKIGSGLASYSVEKDSFQNYDPSLEQVTLRAFEVKTISKNL
ncbi:MAG: PfkB family carbohydrate kinase [Candidatus Hodarchaeales archaeon]